MSDLSIEAQGMIGAFWMFSNQTEVTFQRPHILTKRARKGLDELVEAGFLTVRKFNRFSDALVWEPTDKMKTDKPRVSIKFLKENSFVITDETQPPEKAP